MVRHPVMHAAVPTAGKLRLLLLSAALPAACGECWDFCGAWACPWDFCHSCEWERCDHLDLESGTPEGHAIASFLTHDVAPREAPELLRTGAPLPTASGEEVEVPFSTAASGHIFSSYHLGTNFPMYSPHREAGKTLAPALAEAGIRVWRWPGGAASNFWCPTFEGDEWDACFDV